MSIARTLNDAIAFTGGREPESPYVRVVDSTYHHAEPGETNLAIGAYGGLYFEVSLETLKDIVAWAERKSS